MNLTTQRRIAASILKAGLNKVCFDSEKLDDIKEAITKEDIESLIKQKVIRIRKTNYQSRGRARKIAKQKRKGKRKGYGSRKGKKTARLSKKKIWKEKIRLQRRFLKNLKSKKLIAQPIYRNLLAKAKGGFFRSKRHINLYINEHNLIQK